MTEHYYQLRAQRGPRSGEVIPLEAMAVTIGRDPMSDITINDPEVSRQHARLIATLSGYTIQDLGSTNGTYLDGVRISGFPIELELGQLISLGSNVALVFQSVASSEEGLETILDSGQKKSPGTEPGHDNKQDDEDLDQPDGLAGAEIGVESDLPGENEESIGEQLKARPASDSINPDEPDLVNDNASESAHRDEPAVDDRDEQDSNPNDEAVHSFSPVAVEEQDTDQSEQRGVQSKATPLNEPAPSEVPEDKDEDDLIANSDESAQVEPEQRMSRVMATIIGLLLILICICCGSALFMYNYGGDWLLRFAGILP